MMEKSLTQKMLDLVVDDQFARIEALVTRPNLFRIVGRTFTETWHSMFLGWLMDPKGSHGLKGYPLKKLLLAITNPTIQGKGINFDKIIKLASLGNLDTAKVYPNETYQLEYSCTAGKMDVFIDNLECNDGQKAVILVEQKVAAPVDKDQCKRYADWLYEKYPDNLKILLLIAPDNRLKGSSEDTIGDSRWCGTNYQVLHDVVLSSLSKHPSLSQQTAPLIEHYIDALRIPIDERKLAVTEEEKELARELYDKHKDAFQAIIEALADTEDINIVSPAAQKADLSVKINGDVIKGKTVSELYQEALKFMVSKKIDIKDLVPYATSSKRYLISSSPFHPEEKDFRAPVEFSGYYMEAHKSQFQATKDLARFFKKLAFDVEIVE